MERKFYRFKGAYKQSAIKIIPKIKGQNDYDSTAVLSVNSILKEKNIFDVYEGKKLFDIIQFADSTCNFAISKKLKKVLDEGNISGWDCFPIEIEGIQEVYYAFVNTSKAGEILNLNDVINYLTEYREFDISTWNGSSIFYLDKTTLNVCTEEVMNLILKEKITNIEFNSL